jgi:predicted transcriptional regulator of viral defense system
LAYHVRRGNFVRIARGIYRLRDYPSSANDALYAPVLALAPDGVLSHQSALELYGLADVIPDAIHITVPRSHRRRSRLEGVRIHTAVKPLRRDEITIRSGLPVTGPARTLIDVADAGVAPEQVAAAIRQALRRGLTTADELHTAATDAGLRVTELIQQAVPGPATSRYASAGAFRQALETRLTRSSRESSRSVARLRKEVSFDRLLARLVQAAPGRWILKGGLALDYRFGDRARTTRDLDLDTSGSERDSVRDLRTAAEIDLDDYFRFSLERRELDDPDLDGALGFHVRADVAGRTFDDFVIDVGFSADVDAEPVSGPPLLEFAGLSPVTIPTLAIETHLAEKVHAYTRRYGRGGYPSTRVKDLADVVLIGQEANPSARKLRTALEETFDRRATHPLPRNLPPPPPAWRTPYGRIAREVGLAPDIDRGFASAQVFLDPPLADAALRGTWNAAAQSWTEASRAYD